MNQLENLKSVDWWRNKCLTDLYFLCRVVLQTLENPTNGYKDLYKPTHQKICRFIENSAKPNQRILLLCPRGWIKSYLISIGWIIQKLLNNLAFNKGDTILISNATLANAEMFLEKIKYNLKYNELLRNLFPEIPREPDKEASRWTIDSVKIGRTSIEVGSVEGNLVSKHYSILINDDLVNKENSSTLDQINKVIDWWKLARSLLEANGLEILIGTRWYADDLYGFVLKEFFNISEQELMNHRRLPVLERHKDDYHYLRFLCWQDPENEKGSTFPTLFPEEKLKKIKKEQKEFFDGQYLNDPFSTEGNFLKSTWITRWIKGSLPEVHLNYLLLDPAGKETLHSDFSGMVVVKAGSDKKLYVVYAQRKKATDLKIVEWLIEIASYYQPTIIGIEENKFEIYRDFITFLAPQLVKQGKIAKGSERYVHNIGNFIMPLKPKNRPKELRVKNLQGWIESGKLLFATEGMSALIDELLRFGRTSHDDIVDALAYILDIVIFPTEEAPKKNIIKTPEEIEKEFWESEINAFPKMNLLGETD